MASGNFTLYSKNKNHINEADLAGATLKVMLVTSAYTPDSSVTGNSVLTDANTNEIANGNGYTTGGLTLTSVAVTAITGGYKLTAANSVWTASGGNIPAWRYAVVYASGTLWGLTSPLVGYFLGDTTPADIPATMSGNPLTITWNSSGLFDAT